MKYSAEDRDNIPPVRGSEEEAAQKSTKKADKDDSDKKEKADVKNSSAENAEKEEPLEDNLENYTKNIFIKFKHEIN